ncbi:MAG: T9SS type A sorting domain-containing protein [Ignavibacteria bacterium]|nr:T9SS type A sorting domain-containing protein [Ignavibacteria bacterium]
MKRLIFIILITFYTGSSFSQSGWFIQQSGLSVGLNSIYFVNSNTGWICGDSGKIIKTTNGGAQWILQSSPTQYPLLSVFFLNENTGWCSGGKWDFNTFPSRMLVLKTVNGGSNWIESYYSNSAYTSFGPIYFTDAMHGIVTELGGTGSGSIGGLNITSDGGYSWQLIFNSTSAYTDIQFTDPNKGWALSRYVDDTGGDTGYISVSSDGGNSWNINIQRSQTNFSSLCFYNNNIGWVSGSDYVNFSNNNFVMRTSNAGTSWDKYNFGLDLRLDQIYFTDPVNGWGCSGRIYRTSNSGQNWTQQLDFSGNFYNSILFTDSLTGWAAGDNGVIVKTITGGLTNVNNFAANNPGDFFLHQNFPNPFNPNTIINYEIGITNFVKLQVYDVLGSNVATIVNEKKNAGSHSVEFDGSGIASGIYFYSLFTDGKIIETKRMTLLK